MALVIVSPIVSNLVSSSHAEKPCALLGARWGTSESQVEQALGFQLTMEPGGRFTELPPGAAVTNCSRFSSYSVTTNNFRLFDFPTELFLTFFDHQLYEYTAVLRSFDSTSLVSTLVSHLTDKYRAPMEDDDAMPRPWIESFAEPLHPALRHLRWQSGSNDVHLWLERFSTGYSDTITFPAYEYTARVLVVYTPVRQQIANIAVREHEQIF